MYDNTVIANCDGRACGNPGPVAIGIVLRGQLPTAYRSGGL